MKLGLKDCLHKLWEDSESNSPEFRPRKIIQICTSILQLYSNFLNTMTESRSRKKKIGKESQMHIKQTWHDGGRIDLYFIFWIPRIIYYTNFFNVIVSQCLHILRWAPIYPWVPLFTSTSVEKETVNVRAQSINLANSLIFSLC